MPDQANRHESIRLNRDAAKNGIQIDFLSVWQHG